MAQKVRINGTAYDLKPSPVLINGTKYQIGGGRTLINGTGYDISLQSRTPLSEIPVGNTVKIAVNGTMRDWIVVNQGIPSGSALYDDSCNGTWLLMNDIYTNYIWYNSNTGSYDQSDIHAYLNGTFLSLVDSDIRVAIKQVKIPYYVGVAGVGVTSGAKGLSTKIFLLSGYELGLTTSYNQNIPVEGAKVDYFESGSSTSANNKRIAYLYSTRSSWWTRSAVLNYPTEKAYINTNGVYTSAGAPLTNKNGVRPAIILPFETLVADDGTVLA